MSSLWSLGIRETADLKSDSGITNEESIERDVCNKIAEERQYMGDL